MPAIDDAISYLRQLFEDEAEADNKLKTRARQMNPGDFDENRDRYERPLKDAREAIERYLEARVLRYGRHQDRHSHLLNKFFQAAPYEKSAFIMTKYPGGNDAQSQHLQTVIELVAQSLTAAGLTPRIAKAATFHPSLWDNVELHALGCGLGVAIAESCYAPEFNPNVAMEWGWMRAMGRPVIFLVEKGFQLRADVEGIIREPFDWNDPRTTIPVAIANGIQALRAAGLL